MVRSRCTPIKLQISTHQSLSPTQRSLKADLSLCLCHQCSDLDQKSENLPCSTTRESMLMVPAKRGEKVLPLKMLVEWNNWAWYWHKQKLWEFVVDYALVDCCAPKLSSLRAGIASSWSWVNWTQFLETILQDSHQILTTRLPLMGGVMALRT